MIDKVIFDWSGTLCDDKDRIMHTINGLMNHFNHKSIDFKYLQDNYSRDFLQMYQDMGINTSREEADAVFARCLEECEVPSSMLSGVDDVLRELTNAGKEVYIVSAYNHKNLVEEVNEYGLSEFFKEGNVFGGSIDKPRVIVDIVGKNARNAVYVGDTSVDMEDGKKAGVMSVGVLTGYHRREKLEPHADKIIEDLYGLLSLI